MKKMTMTNLISHRLSLSRDLQKMKMSRIPKIFQLLTKVKQLVQQVISDKTGLDSIKKVTIGQLIDTGTT